MAGFKITLTILLLVTTCVYSLRIHRQRSNSTYEKSLDQLQGQLSDDLTTLKSQMNALNQKLLQAKTEDQQIAVLNENMADERDTIIKIQSYLAAPYQNRPCKYPKITQQQKKQLNTQITQVRTSITVIQDQMEQCENCNMMQELKKELTVQKNYLQIIEDTVNARCSETDCDQGYTYNNNTKKCQLQKSQQDKQKTNGTAVPISKFQCQSPKPYWDNNLQQCIACPSSAPYWNNKLRQCEQCKDNTHWNSTLKTCWRQCQQKGKAYNYQKRQCETVNPNRVSICPYDAPIWDPDTFQCRRCPKKTPYWNEVKQDCQQCPKNTEWKEDLLMCVEICQDGFIVNDKGECEGLCLDWSQPLWNPYKKKCVACPSEKPMWNHTLGQCTACPTKKPTWNNQTLRCQQLLTPIPLTIPLVNSDEVPESNGTKSLPVKDSNVSSCLNGMIFDQAQLRCRCPKDQVFDQASSGCVKCPKGTRYDPNSEACRTIKQQPQINPCPKNQLYNNAFKKCVPICNQDQLFDSSTLTCKKTCPENQVFSLESKKCEDIAFTCPKGAYYDKRNHKCLSCPTGYVYDDKSRKCHYLCKVDQTYSSETGKCQ